MFEGAVSPLQEWLLDFKEPRSVMPSQGAPPTRPRTVANTIHPGLEEASPAGTGAARLDFSGSARLARIRRKSGVNLELMRHFAAKLQTPKSRRSYSRDVGKFQRVPRVAVLPILP